MLEGALGGFTIAVTADRRRQDLVELLEQQGATCRVAPVIGSRSLGSSGELRRVTERVIAESPDAVLLMTGTGVRGWLEAADSMRLGIDLRRALERAELYARGPKALGAAVVGGLKVAWTAPGASSAELAERVRDTAPDGTRLLVVTDGSGSAALVDQLRSSGRQVVEVNVYQISTVTDPGAGGLLARAVAQRRVDAVTFTSRAAVEGFMVLARRAGLAETVEEACRDGVAVFCVGSATAARAGDLGLAAPHWPEPARLGSMVDQVVAWCRNRSVDLELGGLRVALRGRVVAVEGAEPVELPHRERRVLEVLVERAGGVCSKRALLRAGWAGSAHDEHVVEVTIARLRRRLGAAGAAIETVVRRGYRLQVG